MSTFALRFFLCKKRVKTLHEKPAFEERDNGGAKSKVL